ncbi:MAG: pyridoxal-phosphate dependent enzyme [Anaerolineae bacterium]|nr:MAG: pyridoxal-phosphate dependent enzyme [Anaerolineae bacterium]
MGSLFQKIVCRDCGNEMPPDLTRVRCTQCGSKWLNAIYDYKTTAQLWPQAVKERDADLWRYEELLPTRGEHITMGEGWTPLVRAYKLQRELGLSHVFIKDERQSPTGSFKDRQGALVVNIIRQQGINECVLASTGNKAAAYAAYCAKADIRLWIFLTSMVPNEKLRELALYGAEVVKIAGTYEQAKKIAHDFAKRRNLYYDAGIAGIPGREGLKTIAFEIAEQLSRHFPLENGKWCVPDWYIQAVSGGIGPIAIRSGFYQLLQAGLIDRMPKLGLIQVEGCSPMVTAWERDWEEAEAITPRTRITVLATGDPGVGYKILRAACKEDGGTMIAVSDGEAFRAMRRLARTEGISMEPAAAVAFAGLEKLTQEGYIDPDEIVVVNCSGHTFPAEKHILEDQYVLDLELGEQNIAPSVSPATQIEEGLGAALERLDEQVTTIVVIDDNPHDSRLIRRLLQSHKNYRVFEANNPIDGLDLVRHRKPDMIVMDLTMPDMDGFNMLNALKSDPETANIPVMVISAKTLSPNDRERLSKAHSIWQKGNFNTRELVDRVVEVLGNDQIDSEVSQTVQVVSSVDLELPKRPDRKRVLVVDDNRRDARLVKRILEANQNYTVYESYSAQEALDALHEVGPQLLILDLLLPDAPGEALLDEIRSIPDYENIPVIVFTAKSLNDAENDFFRDRNVPIWKKGELDRQELVRNIDKMINR